MGRIVVLLAVAAVIPACGGGGGGGGGRKKSSGSALLVNNSGGSANTGAGSVGGNGGVITVFSLGNLLVGSQAAPAAPVAPPLPLVTSAPTAALAGASYTHDRGNLLLTGNIVLPNAGAGFTINCTEGDVVVSGVLQAGEDPANHFTGGIIINAPNGTVYVTGTIRTTALVATGNPDSGGLTINARQIVITGVIQTRGAAINADPDADGGGIVLDTTVDGSDILILGATIDTSGADGVDDAGFGGSIVCNADGTVRIHNSTITTRAGDGTVDVTGSVEAPGNVTLNGTQGVAVSSTTFNLDGGNERAAAGATGSNGGSIIIPTTVDGPVDFFGTINAPGGNAVADSPNAAVGGNGGNLTIGAAAAGNAPSRVHVGGGTWTINGATAFSGGDSGDITLQNNTFVGDLTAKVNINSNAGHATGATGIPGSALAWTIRCGQGDLTLSGTWTCRGANSPNPASGPTDGPNLHSFAIGSTGQAGSILGDGLILDMSGGSSTGALADNISGGEGGHVDIGIFQGFGPGSVSVSGTITANGGTATGTGTGGQGGGWDASGSPDQPFFVDVDHTARGGNALGAGGTGGDGGALDLISDTDDDGNDGDIIILAGVVIDNRGGTGTTGGAGGSVTLDADGTDNDTAGENGRVINNGSIIATGGATGGDGGTLFFDGVSAALTVPPTTGTVSLAPNGGGAAATVTLQ